MNQWSAGILRSAVAGRSQTADVLLFMASQQTVLPGPITITWIAGLAGGDSGERTGGVARIPLDTYLAMAGPDHIDELNDYVSNLLTGSEVGLEDIGYELLAITPSQFAGPDRYAYLEVSAVLTGL